MPYQAGKRLPAERASRLGHLGVLKSDLVNKLCKSFDEPINSSCPQRRYVGAYARHWTGPTSRFWSRWSSLQVIESETRPHKALAFVKTALLRLDRQALSLVDVESPHPFVLRDILAESALYHATVLPLRHVVVPGMSVYDAVRQVIFESMRDASLDGQPFETLKWLAYEKWTGQKNSSTTFECPHCEKTVASLPYDADTSPCPACGGTVFLTDMLGFHQEMAPDSAPDTVATAYMTVHETLLLFTGIRYFWEKNQEILSKCLFVKDGPLSIRAQYSKLVVPIRSFLQFSRAKGCAVHILGQEKTGTFADHLQLVGVDAPLRSVFIPNNHYIKEQIQHRPDRGMPYGKDTNYGAKVFINWITTTNQFLISPPDVM